MSSVAAPAVRGQAHSLAHLASGSADVAGEGGRTQKQIEALPSGMQITTDPVTGVAVSVAAVAAGAARTPRASAMLLAAKSLLIRFDIFRSFIRRPDSFVGT